MGTYRTNPHIAKPTPSHALTPEAESARQSVRDLPPQRVVRDAGVVKLTRKPLTRAEVVAAYVQPAPLVSGHVVDPADVGGREFLFMDACEDLGADVKVTASRGTTPPRWRVPADTPVDPADYRGDVVDSVVVWATQDRISVDGVTSDGRRHGRAWRTKVRAEWHDGRLHEVIVNGAKSSLKAALEALR